MRLGLKDVKADVKPASDADGKRAQKIEVTVTDGCPAGQYADEVCIDTDDPEYKELRIPLRSSRRPRDRRASGAGQRDDALRQGSGNGVDVSALRDADDREVVVEKAEADHPAVRCKWAAGPGTMTTLRVTVDLSQARAAGVGVVTVKLKGPTAETILIPVSWTLP